MQALGVYEPFTSVVARKGSNGANVKGRDSCDLCPKPGLHGLKHSHEAAKARKGLPTAQAAQLRQAGESGRLGSQALCPKGFPGF
jgi:hypothetical protein